MTPQRENDIRRTIEIYGSIEVILVKDGREERTITFTSVEEAVRDIFNLECEYEVYF